MRNDSDCKDVDLYNARKRYAVIESSDLTRNISWLASCFSKKKNSISIVQEIKVRLPVFAFLTQFSIFILNSLSAKSVLVGEKLVATYSIFT